MYLQGITQTIPLPSPLVSKADRNVNKSSKNITILIEDMRIGVREYTIPVNTTILQLH